MTKREKAYNKKLKDLIDRAEDLKDVEVARVIKILEDARVEVAARVAETEWQAAWIPKLKEGIDRALEGFRQKYRVEQINANQNAWKAGIDVVDGPLSIAGISVLAPELSLTTLSILQGYSADLINGLTADARKKIMSEVTLGIMGQKPQFEVIKAVGRNLDDPSVFKTIASRAETITRTEWAHVNSAAREARIRAVSKEGGTDQPAVKWQKRWIHSGKAHARINHLALDGEVVDIDKKFPNPGGVPIDFPHAPGLPAEEVVNCG